MYEQEADPGGIGFICEVGRNVGWGHLTRSAAVRREIRPRPPMTVAVHDDATLERLRRSSLDAGVSLTSVDHLGVELTRVPRECSVIDGVSEAFVETVAVLDSDCSAVLSPLLPVPVGPALLFHRGDTLPQSWTPKHDDRVFLGPQYAIVSSHIRALSIRANLEDTSGIESKPRIGIMLGGHPEADHIATIDLVLERLDRPDSVLIVAGTGRPISCAVQRWRHLGHRVQRVNPEHPWDAMAVCDIAFTNGGQSLVESLTLGIPALAVTANSDQWLFARTCEDLGICVVIDARTGSIQDGPFARLRRLLDEAKQRGFSRATAMRVFDGKGAERVARAIQGSFPGVSGLRNPDPS